MALIQGLPHAAVAHAFELRLDRASQRNGEATIMGGMHFYHDQLDLCDNQQAADTFQVSMCMIWQKGTV